MFATNTNFYVAVSHSIVFQFLTITDSIDTHYYFFNGEQVLQQGELGQMVEHSLHMGEVLRSIPRFSNLNRSCDYFLPEKEYVEINRIL